MRFHRMLNSTRPSFPLPSRWAAVKGNTPQLKPHSWEKGRLAAESARSSRTEDSQPWPARPCPLNLGGLGRCRKSTSLRVTRGRGPRSTSHLTQGPCSVSASRSMG